MYGRLVFALLIMGCAWPVQSVEAQKFKLSSLLPFKKQSTDVKPFQLTDQAKVKPGRFSNGPIMKLLNPGNSGKNSNTPLAQWNEKSKNFLARTGENISKFATDTRDHLKKIDSPGWDFREPKHWWNQDSAQPDAQALQRELGQLQALPPGRQTPAPLPPPRTARDFQNSPPRHRF